MSAPLRLGLVGCGRLAEHGYGPAAHRTAAVDIVAVADPDAARRQVVAHLVGAGASTHEDAAALLAEAAVDALVLATPAAHHLADAELAVRHGIPVLVEKPPALDAAGARALADLGPGVRIGFNRRFDPAVARLRRDLPRAGALDLHLAITYRRASWSAHVVRDDVVLDLVPHLVDWARWLSRSEVRSVAAVELEPDRAVLDLHLERGRATIAAAADRLHEERIAVRGPGGAALGEHRTGGPVGAVTGRVRGVVGRLRGHAPAHPLAGSLAAQLDDLARTVRGDVPTALATAADGVAAMAVVDAARASSAAGGVPVPAHAHDLPEPTC